MFKIIEKVFKFQQRKILFSSELWRNISKNKSLKFHTTLSVNAKIFLDKENSYAHTILEKSNNYSLCKIPTIINVNNEINIEDILTKNHDNPLEIFESFKQIVNFCNTTKTCISNEKFDKFIDLFTDNCDKFDDDQLIESILLLTLLPEVKGVNTRNFVELWKSLDDVCVQRLDSWSYEKLLEVCDCWYSLSLARTCEFVWEATKKIGRRIKKLTPSQLVQTIFLCNIVRKPLIEMFEFEVNFNKIIDDLTLDEIAVMSMGFFKTKTPIRNPELIEKIYKRLMNELETVEDITFVSILKILRYSSKLPQANIMNELLEQICPYINKISMLSCLHVALIGCDIQQSHDKSLELIIERFNENIDTTRIKDMERISHVMGLYNFETKSGIEKELCQKILTNIKGRIVEIMQYPRCLPACLHYLTLCGYHDEELINSVLDQKYIKHAYGVNMLLGREIFCLDSYTRINLKDSYSGNLLENRQRRRMGKCLTHYIPNRSGKYKINATDRILLEMKETCEDLYRICHLKHVLPHFGRPDILIVYDKSTNRALQLNDECPDDYTGTILSRTEIIPKDLIESNIQTAVIVVGGWNHFVRNKNIPTGLLKLKLQQLEILGHKSVLIPWYEWRNQETLTDKHSFIRRKLLNIL